MKWWQISVALLGIFILFFFFGCQKKVTKTVPASEESLFSYDKTQSTTEETEDFDESMREEKIAVATEDVNLSFTNIYFDFDKYELTSEARETLAEQARILKSNPKVKLLIEGHCDERGTIEYNLALGERRANAVKKYFLNYGLLPERFSIISYGKEKPLDSRHTEEAWAQNRRAVFVITQQ